MRSPSSLAKPPVTERRQEGSHPVVQRGLRLALDNCRGARRPRARRARRAFRRRRALDFRAAGARARRAISLGLVALGAIEQNRLRLRNGRLENIIGKVRNGRDLRLENVLPQIRQRRARRNRRLENVLGHVGFSARRAGGAQRPRIEAAARARLATRRAGVGSTIKPLPRLFQKGPRHHADQKDGNHMIDANLHHSLLYRFIKFEGAGRPLSRQNGNPPCRSCRCEPLVPVRADPGIGHQSLGQWV